MANPLQRLKSKGRSGSPRIVPQSQWRDVGNAAYYGTHGKFRTVSDIEFLTYTHAWLADADIQGNEASMDGTGDAVTITGNPDIHLGGGDFTIEAVVTYSSFPVAFPMIVSKGKAPAPEANQEFAFYYDTGSDKLGFLYNTVGDSGNQTAIAMSNTAVLSTSQEYTLKIVRSGTNIKFYIDDVQQGTDISIGTAVLHSGTNRVLIGAYDSVSSPQPDGYFAGQMSVVRISNVARLTPSSIVNDENTVYMNTFEGANGSAPTLNTK